MNSPVLNLSDVTFRRGGTQILHGIDLRVNEGEHWALLGPNGAGKSTILSFCGGSPVLRRLRKLLALSPRWG